MMVGCNSLRQTDKNIVNEVYNLPYPLSYLSQFSVTKYIPLCPRPDVQ